MLENQMIVGKPGDYYNTPFQRKPIDTWECPSCGTNWKLYAEEDAERSWLPWEGETAWGNTRLSQDPRLDGCCELCTFKVAKTEALTGFVEYYSKMRQVVEEFASEQKYLQIMWDALKNSPDAKTFRDDLADLIECNYEEDFIGWMGGA